jgi:hypothetical protein
MKYSYLSKLVLTVLLLVSISMAQGQVEYRVGLGLYEMTNVFVGPGGPFVHTTVNYHQVLNSAFVERQKNRITHRVTARYINQAHSLKNKSFRPYGLADGFLKSEFDIGYGFLYSVGKHKLFSAGIGLSYLQDKLQSSVNTIEFIDFKNKAIAPSFSIEANFKVHKTWYISPSIVGVYPIYFASSNKSISPFNSFEWPKQLEQWTPIRISIKKTLISK